MADKVEIIKIYRNRPKLKIQPMTWERKGVINELKRLHVKGWTKYTPTKTLKNMYYKRIGFRPIFS